MNRNEQQMYSDITSIRKSLEKIANALEGNSKKDENITAVTPTGDTIYYKTRRDMYMDNPCTKEEYEAHKANDIPGFEGTLDTLHNLYGPGDISIPKDEYKYVSKVGKIKNDSDFDIRVTAKMYEDDVLANGGTKKDCILDYVTNEFGILGARYTDVIKFAYYLGAPNAPKYASENRGYYSCAFSSRMGGHLIQGGKDQLVKGINKEGEERYFALSSVDSFTDYYKRLDQ